MMLKLIIRMAVVLLVMSLYACETQQIRDAAPYGMLPLSPEISDELKPQIGASVDEQLKNQLQTKYGITVEYLKDESPIDYRAIESPDVTIEPKYGDAAKEQLQKLLKAHPNWQGIIFGHIREDWVDDSLYVIVRVYREGQEKYESVGQDKPIKLEQVSEKTVNQQLVLIAGDLPIKRQQILAQAPPEHPESNGEKDVTQQESSESNGEKEEKELDITHQSLTQDSRSLKGDIASALQAEEIKPSTQTQISYETSAYDLTTLKGVYKMLYEQGLMVEPDTKHQAALEQLVQEKGKTIDSIKMQLSGATMRLPMELKHKSCWQDKFVLPKNDNVAEQKSFQFYIHSHYKLKDGEKIKKTDLCQDGFDGRRRMISYQGAKQKVADLNKERVDSIDTEWRIPTIEELFALADYLRPPKNDEVAAYWSSTTNSEGEMWVMLFTRNPKRIYKLDTLRNKAAVKAFLIPIRTCKN